MARTYTTLHAISRERAPSISGDDHQPRNQNQIEIVVLSDSDEDASGSEMNQSSLCSRLPGSISDVENIQLDHLKCPICIDYPRQEVYQCINGHSVCRNCATRMLRCPICRTSYDTKIRNFAVEKLLDTLKYNCSYISGKDGCRQIMIPRNRRNAHEIQCPNNPSTTLIKLCELFDSTESIYFLEGCQFKICPKSIMEDPQHTKDVIEHLTSETHNLPYQKVIVGEQITIRFRLPATLDPQHLTPVKLFEVNRGQTGGIVGYYLLFQKYDPNILHKSLSWTVVGFTSAPAYQDPETFLNRKIRVNFLITPKINSRCTALYGVGCVSNQNWRIEAMLVDEWKLFMNIPPNYRPKFSYELPVSLLRDYYKQEDMCEMNLSFN